jgi:hypothetical protein
MLDVPAFVWYTGHLERSFLEGVPTWSLDLTFYALSKLFLSSASRTMGPEADFLPQNAGSGAIVWLVHVKNSLVRA